MKKIGLILSVSLAMLAHPAMAEDCLMEGLTIARACADDVVRLCEVLSAEISFRLRMRSKATVGVFACIA
jgi:hypothetical protein